MSYDRGQKLKHKKYGTCYFYGETHGGNAIIELYKNKVFIDRLSSKYEDLKAIQMTRRDKGGMKWLSTEYPTNQTDQ